MRAEESPGRARIGWLASWLGPFVYKAQRRCSLARKLPSRESQGEAHTYRQCFSPHGRSWLASLHSQDEAFRNWPYSTVKFASFGELLPGDSFSSITFVDPVTWGRPTEATCSRSGRAPTWRENASVMTAGVAENNRD